MKKAAGSLVVLVGFALAALAANDNFWSTSMSAPDANQFAKGTLMGRTQAFNDWLRVMVEYSVPVPSTGVPACTGAQPFVQLFDVTQNESVGCTLAAGSRAGNCAPLNFDVDAGDTVNMNYVGGVGCPTVRANIFVNVAVHFQ
jgi:hypothetical protein